MEVGRTNEEEGEDAAMADDEDDYDDQDYETGDDSRGPGTDLGHEIEEMFLGDGRFRTVDLASPGPLDGEALRVSLIVDDVSEFFVSILPDEGFVRVGLSLSSDELSQAIEEAILETGLSMTEFISQAAESEDELEHEVHHFEDDTYYFAADIPFETEEQLDTEPFREEITNCLGAFIDALLDLVGE